MFSVRQGAANKPGILRKSRQVGFADHVFPMLQSFSFRFRIPVSFLVQLALHQHFKRYIHPPVHDRGRRAEIVVGRHGDREA